MKPFELMSIKHSQSRLDLICLCGSICFLHPCGGVAKNMAPCKHILNCVTTDFAFWDKIIISVIYSSPKTDHFSWLFYPRPVLALGMVVACVCPCVSVCMCVSVCQSRAFVRENSSHLREAKTTKFRQKCKTSWLWSLLIWGMINLGFHGPLYFKS